MRDYELRWKRGAKNKKTPRCAVQAENILLRCVKSMFEDGVGVTFGVKVATEVATGRWDTSSFVDFILGKDKRIFLSAWQKKWRGEKLMWSIGLWSIWSQTNWLLLIELLRLQYRWRSSSVEVPSDPLVEFFGLKYPSDPLAVFLKLKFPSDPMRSSSRWNTLWSRAFRQRTGSCQIFTATCSRNSISCSLFT